MKASPRRLKPETFGKGNTTLHKTGMFGGPTVIYHQSHSARDLLSMLRIRHPIQNLQKSTGPTEEALAQAAVTLETGRNKGSNP